MVCVLTLFLALDRSADSRFLIILMLLRSSPLPPLTCCTSMSTSSPANPARETGVEGNAWPAMTTAPPSSSSCSVEMEKRELQPLTKLSCGLSGSLHAAAAAAAACTAIW